MKSELHGSAPYSRHLRVSRWERLRRTFRGRLLLLGLGVVTIMVVTAVIDSLAGSREGFGDSAWSALVHLLDPGALGGDHGAVSRIIGLAQSVTGIVFLLGVLLAVLTEVVDRTLLRARPGDSAVDAAGHLLVIGFNPTLDRVVGLLASQSQGDLPPLVVLLPPESASLYDAVDHILEAYPAESRVLVEDGRTSGLDRAGAATAERIVILSPDIDPDRADLEVTARAELLARHLEGAAGSPSVAAELRRGRNLEALWRSDDGQDNRFPDSFDALVNDRNSGALLALAALNPDFTRVFLPGDGEVAAPALAAADPWIGKPFGEVRDRFEGATVLGLLTGSGPAALATYLPSPSRPVGPGDRLIVIEDDSPGTASGAGSDPDSVKIAPARPGPVLILGFSDAAACLVRALRQAGTASPGIAVLVPDNRHAEAARLGDDGIDLARGNPVDPDDVAYIVSRVEPALVFIAAPTGRSPEAVIASRLARRQTEAPVVVEQDVIGPELAGLVSDNTTAVSVSDLNAEAVCLSLTDPALLVAREAMLDDPGLVVETLAYTGSSPLPLSDIPGLFTRAGYYPLAVSLDGEYDDRLAQGDRVLCLHREGPA